MTRPAKIPGALFWLFRLTTRNITAVCRVPTLKTI